MATSRYDQVEYDHDAYRYLLWEQGNPVHHNAYWVHDGWVLQPASEKDVTAISANLEVVCGGMKAGWSTRYSSTLYRLPKPASGEGYAGLIGRDDGN